MRCSLAVLVVLFLLCPAPSFAARVVARVPVVRPGGVSTLPPNLSAPQFSLSATLGLGIDVPLPVLERLVLAEPAVAAVLTAEEPEVPAAVLAASLPKKDILPLLNAARSVQDRAKKDRAFAARVARIRKAVASGDLTGLFEGAGAPALEGLEFRQRGRALLDRGVPTRRLGVGFYGAVYEHPRDPRLVVKLMKDDWATPPWQPYGEDSAYVNLAEEGVAVALHAAGVGPAHYGLIEISGRAGSIRERVFGRTVSELVLRGMFGERERALVDAMLEKLADARVAIGDVRPANVMIGHTASDLTSRALVIDGGFTVFRDPSAKRSDFRTALDEIPVLALTTLDYFVQVRLPLRKTYDLAQKLSGAIAFAMGKRRRAAAPPASPRSEGLLAAIRSSPRIRRSYADFLSRRVLFEGFWEYRIRGGLARLRDRLAGPQPGAPGPDALERDAIRAYGGFFYVELNRFLRDPSWEKDPADARALAALAELAREGLAKLPDYRGTVYRTLFPKDPALHERYVPGEIVEEAGFTSASRAPRKLPVAGGGSARLVFVIGSKTGKRIDSIAYRPSEKEVLFAPGTRFRVLAKESRRSRLLGREIEEQVIRLEEVGG